MSNRRGLPLVVGLLTLATIGAACGSSRSPSSSNTSRSNTTTTSSRSNATATHAGAKPATPTENVPTEAQLKSALLTEADLGRPFTTTSTSRGSARAGSCKRLANDLNDASPVPGEKGVAADFEAHKTTLVRQALWSVPVSSLESSVKKLSEDIASCREINSKGVTLRFALTPLDFAAGATGASVGGTYQGANLNGYLVVQGVSRNVGMLFEYLQLGSGSSQRASQIYDVGLNKAKRAFPTS